jgi:hypothetical protein
VYALAGDDPRRRSKLLRAVPGGVAVVPRTRDERCAALLLERPRTLWPERIGVHRGRREAGGGGGAARAR